MIDSAISPIYEVPYPCGPGLSAKRAGEFGRRLSVLLQHGLIAHAHVLVDEADQLIRDRSRSRTVDEILDTPLVNVIPVRLANTLESLEIFTVGDLQRERHQLDCIAGVGEHGRRLVDEVLAKLDHGE